MTKQMTVRDFVQAGFTITEDTSGSDSVEAMATAEMRQRGYKFVGYDDNGDELMSKED